MKKIVFFILAGLLFAGQAKAQNVEVLYFRADLGCCQARACEFFSGQVKEAMEQNYNSKDVVFRVVRIASPDNADLVKAHNARSMSLVVVNSANGKSKDMSHALAEYRRDRDMDKLEAAIAEAVDETR